MEVLSMEDFVSIISNVGFPIFIAMFILIRLESKIEKLAEAFMELTKTIKLFMAQVEESEEDKTNKEVLERITQLCELLKGKN